jgi:hypothetical protein
MQALCRAGSSTLQPTGPWRTSPTENRDGAGPADRLLSDWEITNSWNSSLCFLSATVMRAFIAPLSESVGYVSCVGYVAIVHLRLESRV